MTRMDVPTVPLWGFAGRLHALNYDRGTPIATIIAHVAFGALLGVVYHV